MQVDILILKYHMVQDIISFCQTQSKLLLIQSIQMDTINNPDFNDTYKDLYLSEKQHEEKLLQGIQSANSLKARTD